jgi:hypothetical protein
MSPAGNKSEGSLGTFRDQLRTTYSASSIALEYDVVDLHIRTVGKNSAALEVVCPPPGIGAKI